MKPPVRKRPRAVGKPPGGPSAFPIESNPQGATVFATPDVEVDKPPSPAALAPEAAEWWPKARCNDGNGTLSFLFFSEDLIDIARAKAICSRCAVREACLAAAEERAEPWGVWGGQLFIDGRIVAQKRRRGRPPSTPGPSRWSTRCPSRPWPSRSRARADPLSSPRPRRVGVTPRWPRRPPLGRRTVRTPTRPRRQHPPQDQEPDTACTLACRGNTRGRAEGPCH